MRHAGSSRLLRALQTFSVTIAVVVACTVADKDDYTFTDEPTAGSGGEATGGTVNTGGTSGSSARGGTSGAGRGGSSGTSGSSGTGPGGEGGEGGVPDGGGQGGGAGEPPTGECGDGTRDPGEDCDDGNRRDEDCPYFSASCDGCSRTCRRLRPPSCGDGATNGVQPTSVILEYLATSCTTTPYVPLYLNGVLIPNLPFGAYCLCAPGIQQVTVTDPAVLAAVRQQGNAISSLGTGLDYLAWALMTVTFSDGTRVEKVAFDFGPSGDAERRSPGYGPTEICPVDFIGFGPLHGAAFGGYPVEQCDGEADCSSCSLPSCVTVSLAPNLAIPDRDTTTGANGTLQTSVVVPELGTVRDVDVLVNATHTYDGDLVMSLISPYTSTVLVGNKGTSGDNFTDTLFDSSCTTPIASGVAPFTGCFAPDSTLDVFNMFQRSAGSWTLKVEDTASTDTGTLNSWAVKVCGVP